MAPRMQKISAKESHRMDTQLDFGQRSKSNMTYQADIVDTNMQFGCLHVRNRKERYYL